MMPDADLARAFARLADALDADLQSVPDGEIAEAFHGREARVAADALRQHLRRIGAAHLAPEPTSAAPGRGGVLRSRDREGETP